MSHSTFEDHLSEFIGKEVLVLCVDGVAISGILDMVGDDHIGFNEAVMNVRHEVFTNEQYVHHHIPFTAIVCVSLREIV